MEGKSDSEVAIETNGIYVVCMCADDQVATVWLELILVLALLPSQPHLALPDNLSCGGNM